VPAQIVPMAILPVLAVRLVARLIVGDQVVQGETVVSGHEIEARRGLATVVPKNVARSGEALRELADAPAVAAPEGTHCVAVAVVPLAPAGRESTELVAARPEIPGLGDQLDVSERGLGAQRAEK